MNNCWALFDEKLPIFRIFLRKYLHMSKIFSTFASAKVFLNMAQEEAIKLFENSKVRIVWDDEKEKYFFSIVDVIQVLTETPNARKYWSVLKTRLKQEGSELATNCSQLKLSLWRRGQLIPTLVETKPLQIVTL